jgi:hypothetical protein
VYQAGTSEEVVGRAINRYSRRSQVVGEGEVDRTVWVQLSLISDCRPLRAQGAVKDQNGNDVTVYYQQQVLSTIERSSF